MARYPGRLLKGALPTAVILLLLLAVACGAAATATPAPTAVSATTAPADPTPTLGFVSTPTAVPMAATATPRPTPTPGVVASARDNITLVAGEEPTTLGAFSQGCSGNVPSMVCEEVASEPLTWIDSESFEVVSLSGVERVGPKKSRTGGGSS